jgi:hypothetical protein
MIPERAPTKADNLQGSNLLLQAGKGWKEWGNRQYGIRNSESLSNQTGVGRRVKLSYPYSRGTAAQQLPGGFAILSACD